MLSEVSFQGVEKGYGAVKGAPIPLDQAHDEKDIVSGGELREGVGGGAGELDCRSVVFSEGRKGSSALKIKLIES